MGDKMACLEAEEDLCFTGRFCGLPDGHDGPHQYAETNKIVIYSNLCPVNRCPYPSPGDDGTIKQCVANGNCGCDEKLNPGAA